ncbi:MAG: transporter [Enterovirga sp.]|nr:transporter [Enterovirga sp.]
MRVALNVGELEQVARPTGERDALPRVIGTLASTQLLAWGTTFYLPAVLAADMAAATGLAVDAVFGGLSLMLLVGALAAPVAGRILDRNPARSWMVLGSILIGIGLMVLSRATGPVQFFAAWILIGIAFPFGMGQAASTAIVQFAPGRARRALALLLLFGGMASTVSWPMMIWLESLVGWRGTLTIFAAVHVFVCAPIHWLIVPGRRPSVPDSTEGPGPAADLETGDEPPRPIRGAFPLAAIALSVAGFATWGIPLQLIAMLQDLGHSTKQAVLIGALFGPAQIVARAVEIFFGSRLSILRLGVISLMMIPCALAVLYVWGGTLAGALVFSLVFGMAAGLTSIVRAISPLRLFGRQRYARIAGWLGAPQNAAFAASPFAFAWVRQTADSGTAMLLGIAASLVALAAMVVLARRAGE